MGFRIVLVCFAFTFKASASVSMALTTPPYNLDF
jgi:hypothetical protein